MRKIKSVLGVLVLISLATGCASTRRTGWEQAADSTALTDSEKHQLLTEAKQLWQNRHVQSDLEKALENFQKIATADPSNYEALTYLTRGYYLLADGILENMSEKKKNWETSVSWGEKGMATNPAFKKAVVDEKKSVTESVALLDKDQIDALYWATASLGKWAKNSGIMTTLQYKSQIKAMIERVAQLQEDYFYGAVSRYWGVYYAVAPGFAGGSMEKSLESFKKSMKVANNYLGTHVLFAENYAARNGDKETFKKELQFVLNAKPDVIPELTPENTLEKAKAKKLLDKMEDYF